MVGEERSWKMAICEVVSILRRTSCMSTEAKRSSCTALTEYTSGSTPGSRYSSMPSMALLSAFRAGKLEQESAESTKVSGSLTWPGRSAGRAPQDLDFARSLPPTISPVAENLATVRSFRGVGGGGDG